MTANGHPVRDGDTGELDAIPPHAGAAGPTSQPRRLTDARHQAV